MRSKKPTPLYASKVRDHGKSINWRKEFLRPWKLATLALGIILLLIGSVVMEKPGHRRTD